MPRSPPPRATHPVLALGGQMAPLDPVVWPVPSHRPAGRRHPRPTRALVRGLTAQLTLSLRRKPVVHSSPPSPQLLWLLRPQPVRLTAQRPSQLPLLRLHRLVRITTRNLSSDGCRSSSARFAFPIVTRTSSMTFLSVPSQGFITRGAFSPHSLFRSELGANWTHRDDARPFVEKVPNSSFKAFKTYQEAYDAYHANGVDGKVYVVYPPL